MNPLFYKSPYFLKYVNTFNIRFTPVKRIVLILEEQKITR